MTQQRVSVQNKTTPPHSPPLCSAPPPSLAPACAAAFAVDDEYDPAAPTDYLAILAARKATADADAARVTAARAAAAAAVDAAARAAAAAAATEAAALARARAEALTKCGGGGGGEAEQPSPPPPAKGLALAERMMKKMGWRSGGGLGRDLQGMATPLVAHRTGRASGVVAPAAPLAGGGGVSASGASSTHPTTLSRVVLLTNLVLPGAVDEALEDEVGAEATRHGTVTGLVVFEVIEPGFPPSEAVRVFVRFADAPSAAAFAAAMAGRYFGGRRVGATMFSEATFDAGALAPSA